MVGFLRFAFILALMAAAFGSGVLLSWKSGGLRDSLTTLQREVRQTLGVEKRWFPVPNAPASRAAVACPDPALTHVVLTGGQSNAANSFPALSPSQSEQVFTYYQGACYQTSDPVLGASATGGSLWPGFGAALSAELGGPVLFLNTAIGGTEVSDWLDPRSGYFAALETRVAGAKESGFDVDLVIWHQGETDANTQPGPAPFVEVLSALTERVLTVSEAPSLYLFQTSRCIGPRRIAGVSFIRDGQAEVASNNPQIQLGMNTDELGFDFRYDQCHFNSFGRDAVIAQAAPEVAELLRK